MSLESLIVFFGALIALLAWLGGFPAEWDKAIIILCGLAVVGLGITLHRRLGRAMPPRHGEFVESRPRSEGKL